MVQYMNKICRCEPEKTRNKDRKLYLNRERKPHSVERGRKKDRLRARAEDG